MGVATAPLTVLDLHKIDQMLNRSYFSFMPKIREELEILQRGGVKAEIEGVIKSVNYLRDFYFPIKLCNRDYI